MSKNGLIYPRLYVEMSDGAEFEVQPIGPDQINWELTAVKHHWPDFQKTPALWQTFLAWSGLRREGMIPQTVTWDQFRTDHRFVQPADLGADEPVESEGDEGPADATPTGPVVVTG